MARTPFDAELRDRLVRYCAIDSQSDERSGSVPSTACQFDMLHLLQRELAEIGARDVRLTDYGVVLATVPATVEGAPTIGLLAHVDTAPAFAAAGVKPRVHSGYDGGEIRFPDAPDLVLSPAVAPPLADRSGHDIVTASGTTLLGADDKSGVAIAMTLAHHLLSTPGLGHGAVRLAFTPDEEIGRGVTPDLARDLAAEFAYTLDGGLPGEVDYESFSADGAWVRISGVSTHAGTAKGKMVNALTLAARIAAALPPLTTPEATEGREGFIHQTGLRGTAAEAEMRFILRDFEIDGLARLGEILRQTCAAVAVAEPRARIDCEIAHQYRNMRYWLEKDMTPVNLALDACRDVGLAPVSRAIRGGTDGSRLTEFGVPCPNIFTGMQDIHGPLEWISVQDMALALRVVLRVLERAAE
jgi:tripeptide aminopeptidase